MLCYWAISVKPGNIEKKVMANVKKKTEPSKKFSKNDNLVMDGGIDQLRWKNHRPSLLWTI